MSKRCVLICMLVLAWGVTSVCQSTSVAVKIGNNGNVSFTNKYKSGNYTEVYRFGNGYQAGVEIHQPFTSAIGIKAEASYLNSYSEMDHDSHWPSENGRSRDNYFYEEIAINNSSFNLSTSAVLSLGRFKIGVGPELAMNFQSSGRGLRYNYNLSSFDGSPDQVQYRFHSKRKQVYNLNNPDELHTFDVNRIIWGLNFNVNVLVFRSFAIELKTFYPMTEMISGFKGLVNDKINQKTINAQVSVVYSFPLILNRSYKPKSKLKKRVKR